jgi:hypothetical protein
MNKTDNTVEQSQKQENKESENAVALSSLLGNWKDETNYSREDKNRVPTLWTTDIGGLRIVVTCGHIYYKGIWIMHCHRIGIESKVLYVDTKEKAQIKAIQIVKQKIDEWHKAFSEVA